jgi:hypothetical protein
MRRLLGLPLVAALATGAALLLLGAVGASWATRAKPNTLVTENGRILAFAQDAGAIAWIGHDYQVHVRRLSARRGSIVGSAASEYNARRWPLALAGTQALWTSYSAGNFIYTSVHTGSPTMLDHVVYNSSYMPGPPDGSWIEGFTGDGSTLVLGDVRQRCDVEWDCRRIDVEGGVQRVTAKAVRIAGLRAPFLLAASSGRIALVPAKAPRFFPDIGPPRAAEYAPVQVYDLGGHLLSSVVPDGTPRSIALAWPRLAVLFELVDGRRQMQLYDARNGAFWASGGAAVGARVPVTVSRVSVSEAGAVYSAGKAIYLLRRQTPKLVARAAGTPIGLSIEGRRIAWAENVHGKGRIRSLTTP